MLWDVIYQLSAFGDITSIKPTPEIIKSMMERLSEYSLLPSVVQEMNVTIPPSLESSKPPVNRLQMISGDRGLTVMFASNRIDISKVATDFDKGVAPSELDELYKILKIVTEGLAFTRIGFNTTSILNNPSESLWKKIKPELTCYSNPIEYMLRVNERSSVDLSEGSAEMSNAILTVQKTVGQLLINNQPVSVNDGLIVQYDINTIQENMEPRFFSDQVEKYIVSAEKFRQLSLIELISQ